MVFAAASDSTSHIEYSSILLFFGLGKRSIYLFSFFYSLIPMRSISFRGVSKKKYKLMQEQGLYRIFFIIPSFVSGPFSQKLVYFHSTDKLTSL